MSENELGFTGAVSIGLGGMIGGGVFAVLGVVASVAGSAAWMAFVAASLISMCAAYNPESITYFYNIPPQNT